MCVTVGDTTLNEVVHIMFWTQNHGRVYTSVKITLYPLHHWSPLKNGKIALAHRLTRSMSVNLLFGIGTMDK